MHVSGGGKTASRSWRQQVARLRYHSRREANLFHLRLGLAQIVVRCLPYGNLNVLRTAVYRWAGFADIGPHVYIRGTLDLRGMGDIYSRLHIGEYSSINTPCHINLDAPVFIGKHVGIGHHTVIVTSNHQMGPATERRGRLQPAPVTIEDGAWIGAHVLLLPGVTVGKGSVVAAGSIVQRDVPANTMTVPQYSRVIRALGS